MGNKASRIFGTVVRRPMQRYNVERRAEKVVTKIQDPQAASMRAPMYQTDTELLEEIRRTNPEIAESAVKKDIHLHDRLMSVYVTSKDPESKEVHEDPTKPLPRDTLQYSYDFVPAQIRLDTSDRRRDIPRGKVSLEQTIDFLTKYKETEGKFNHELIANQYRLNPDIIKQSVKYFTIFNIMETKAKAEPEIVDPLSVGKDWVERHEPLKNLQDPGRHIKKYIHDSKEVYEKHQGRIAKEKVFSGEKKERIE